MPNIRQFKNKYEQQYDITIDIDKIIKSVQDPAVKHKNQKVNISEKQFIALCRIGRNLLLKQPSLLRLNGPIFVATGTIGYYKDLTHIIARCGHQDMTNYLFLGDYIGKGDRNIECLVLLISLKIKLENNFFLLRGCMDSIAMSRSYNLYDECVERFSPKAWSEACEILCSLPFAAIIQNQIFCCHGGIGPSLRYAQQINRITRPIETPQKGIACDLIWACPSRKSDSLAWSVSQRGFSFSFHQKVAEYFLKQNHFSMMCVGHEVIYNGFNFNKDKTVATICSFANYGGTFNNSAAVLVINSQYQLFFKVIKQRQYFPIETNSENVSLTIQKVIKQKKKRKQEQKQKQNELEMLQNTDLKKNNSEHSVEQVNSKQTVQKQEIEKVKELKNEVKQEPQKKSEMKMMKMNEGMWEFNEIEEIRQAQQTDSDQERL